MHLNPRENGIRFNSASVEEEFDGKAVAYESNRLADWYKAQGEYVLPLIENATGSIVDVGCGTGWLLRRILRQNPDAKGIGIDLSGRMIEEADKRARAERIERISFIHGNWESPVTRKHVCDQLDQPASFVVCVSAFHYFQDPAIAVRSMHDLLAYKGKILLLDRALEGSMGTFVWDLLHRYLIKDQVRFYSTSEMVALLEESGFNSVQVPVKINRLFWKGKLYTSLVLISGMRG